MKKLFVLSMLVSLLFVGCSGAQLDPNQEDAIIRTAGNGLATILIIAKPEIAPAAKVYCERFATVEDMLEAQILLETGLTYLADKYTDTPKLSIAVINLLKIIGYDQAEALVMQRIDGATKTKDFTEDMFRKTLLVAKGFCEMF